MNTYIEEYPRPQLVRKRWTNLNGIWDFRFDDENKGEWEKWYADFPEAHQKIQVPFTYETDKSGIAEHQAHWYVWYHREIRVSDLKNTDCQILHFEGSDFWTKVWVNGNYVGEHKGAYARFSFDISKFLQAGVNEITVRVEDGFSTEQPRGKQRWVDHNFGCWYVQTTGIWKSVWMESVNKKHIHSIKMTPELVDSSVIMECRIANAEQERQLEIVAEISYHDTIINKVSMIPHEGISKVTTSVAYFGESEWSVHLWTPEHPDLYDVRVRLLEDGKIIDEIFSYFGMREIRIEKGNILLNGSPVYQRLILDQGYWKESGITPPSEQAMIEDIDKIQAMGFNGLRKHMKIEDERFLYWCDVKGLLVWSEMAAAYQFTDEAVAEYTKEWLEAVRQNYNHPCIITWTPFNESWGVSQIKTDVRQQAFTRGIYELTKSIDPMRPVITNDGWEHTTSDIITLHDYEESDEPFLERYQGHLEELMSGEIYHSGSKSAMANGNVYHGQPVIISEYGGIAFNGGEDDSWGYGNLVKTEEEFLVRYEKITDAIKKLPYVCGYCYTQVSDVEQEVNGLLDAAHNYKIDAEKIEKINLKEVGIHKMK